MSKSRKAKKSIINDLFNRREQNRPGYEETDIVSTLQDIAAQVRQEAIESRVVSPGKKEFRSLSGGLAVKVPAASAKKEMQPTAPQRSAKFRRARLTADQYENLIENDLTWLDIIGPVIDRNMAITTRIKKACE